MSFLNQQNEGPLNILSQRQFRDIAKEISLTKGFFCINQQNEGPLKENVIDFL